MPKLSEADYRSCILEPELEKLGYPHRDINICRRGKGFKDYSGIYRLDYLFSIEHRPILDIEAKPTEKQFDTVYNQATYYARNFEPTKVIPYIICAAGSAIKMYKAISSRSGVGVEFQELEELLTWEELQRKVKEALVPTTVEAATGTTLGLENFKSIFEELFKILRSCRRPKFRHDDEVVLVMNAILRATITKQSRDRIYKKLPKRVVARIEEVLGWYPLTKIEGHNLAYAYREFVTRNFTGTTPWWAEAGEKEIGRYLTPASVVKFMVELCDPGPEEKVIDFACGSGGFLGAVANRMLDKIKINHYLSNKLFACDADLFSVSTAQTFMELLLPGKQIPVEISEKSFYTSALKSGEQITIDDYHPDIGITRPRRLPFTSTTKKGVLNIFHHNGLFSKKIHSWEHDLGRFIPEKSFDVVISNPPAGANYNLGHEDELKKLFPMESRRKKLQNAPLFIQRAIHLAKNGGKICLIIPDGILANIQLRYLQDYIFGNYRVKVIVSLPRGIFPNVPSKMSVLYMIKTKKPALKEPIFMAAVKTGVDPETGEEYNLESELADILKEYRKFK